ncbi:MAG: hypothetical protein WDM85_02700 [Caulobacteraceae bacterium]
MADDHIEDVPDAVRLVVGADDAEMPRRSPGGESASASSIAKSTNARRAPPREPSKFILAAPPRLFAVVAGPLLALERLERQSGYIAADANRASLRSTAIHHRQLWARRETMNGED